MKEKEERVDTKEEGYSNKERHQFMHERVWYLCDHNSETDRNGDLVYIHSYELMEYVATDFVTNLNFFTASCQALSVTFFAKASRVGVSHHFLSECTCPGRQYHKPNPRGHNALPCRAGELDESKYKAAVTLEIACRGDEDKTLERSETAGVMASTCRTKPPPASSPRCRA
ncbi:hypothetical protein J6590_015415 [Homalodisca vitripennis]|nr:hypothetical protein J6590_015415 [Homalodisca vitripennis]